MSKNLVYAIVIGIGCLSAAVIVWQLLPRGASRESSPSAEQLRATIFSSSSPEERAKAVDRLSALADAESGDLLFKLVDDPEPLVRGRAGAAIQRMIGANYYYRAEAPREARAAIVKRMKWDFDKLKAAGAFAPTAANP